MKTSSVAFRLGILPGERMAEAARLKNQNEKGIQLLRISRLLRQPTKAKKMVERAGFEPAKA
jgi:hypothetical protein